MLLLSFRLLFLLLFRRDRGIDFQHALGKVHAHLLLRHVDSFQVRFSERNIKLLACTVRNNQQWGLACTELNGGNWPIGTRVLCSLSSRHSIAGVDTGTT